MSLFMENYFDKKHLVFVTSGASSLTLDQICQHRDGEFYFILNIFLSSLRL